MSQSMIFNIPEVARAVQQTAFWLIHSIIESKTIFQAVNPAFSFNPLPPSHQKILTRSQRKSKSLFTTNPLAAERANPVFQDNSAITVVIICNDGCQGQSCAVICPALWSSHEGHSYSAHGLSWSERGVKELPLLTFTEKKYKIQLKKNKTRRPCSPLEYYHVCTLSRTNCWSSVSTDMI